MCVRQIDAFRALDHFREVAMIFAHMSAAQSEAIFRFVILAAFVLVSGFFILNFVAMWAATKFIARRSIDRPNEPPTMKFQFSTKTLLLLMTVVAGYGFIMRLSRPGGVEFVLVLCLGCWLVAFAVVTWALAKTFTHEFGVIAKPLVISGAIAGASAAAFQALLLPAPLFTRLYYLGLSVLGGGLSGFLLGLVYYAVAWWTTKSR